MELITNALVKAEHQTAAIPFDPSKWMPEPTGENPRMRVPLLAIACLVLSANTTLSAERATDHPNVILILADDLGWADLGCYGNRFNETPHIDGLARDGIRFTQFSEPAVTIAQPPMQTN
jgi:hypothetical protein